MAEPDGEAASIADRIASSGATSSSSSSSGPVWQREWFSVLPELEEWARYTAHSAGTGSLSLRPAKKPD